MGAGWPVGAHVTGVDNAGGPLSSPPQRRYGCTLPCCLWNLICRTRRSNLWDFHYSIVENIILVFFHQWFCCLFVVVAVGFFSRLCLFVICRTFTNHVYLFDVKRR